MSSVPSSLPACNTPSEQKQAPAFQAPRDKFSVLDAIAQAEDLSRPALRVMSALMRRAWGSGEARPRPGELAEACQLHPEVAKRAVRELAAAGFIRSIRGQYRITFLLPWHPKFGSDRTTVVASEDGSDKTTVVASEDGSDKTTVVVPDKTTVVASGGPSSLLLERNKKQSSSSDTPEAPKRPAAADSQKPKPRTAESVKASKFPAPTEAELENMAAILAGLCKVGVTIGRRQAVEVVELANGDMEAVLLWASMKRERENKAGYFRSFGGVIHALKDNDKAELKAARALLDEEDRREARRFQSQLPPPLPPEEIEARQKANKASADEFAVQFAARRMAPAAKALNQLTLEDRINQRVMVWKDGGFMDTAATEKAWEELKACPECHGKGVTEDGSLCGTGCRASKIARVELAAMKREASTAPAAPVIPFPAPSDASEAFKPAVGWP